MNRTTFALSAVFLCACGSAPVAEEAPEPTPSATWETVETAGSPTARHETAFIEAGGKFYLIGGRGMKPVDVYDPATNAWSTATGPPLEIHHFQPVLHQGRILIVGAFTGGYPHETPVPHVLIYDPASDEWSEGATVPEGRRRGAAGVAVQGDKLYLVCGIVDGHYDGWSSWVDELDLTTGEWRRLPDAPRPRDHFQAVLLDGKVYAAAGRTSSAKTGDTFKLSIAEVDVFDLKTETWSTAAAPIPTMRAGTSSLALDGKIIVAGGESGEHEAAHAEVEAFDPAASAWESLPSLVRGRHGTGLIHYGGKLWTAAGSGNRGGGPELDTLESLELR